MRWFLVVPAKDGFAQDYDKVANLCVQKHFTFTSPTQAKQCKWLMQMEPN